MLKKNHRPISLHRTMVNQAHYCHYHYDTLTVKVKKEKLQNRKFFLKEKSLQFVGEWSCLCCHWKELNREVYSLSLNEVEHFRCIVPCHQCCLSTRLPTKTIYQLQNKKKQTNTENNVSWKWIEKDGQRLLKKNCYQRKMSPVERKSIVNLPLQLFLHQI